MFKKGRKPGEYILFVVVILLVSFLVNVWISLDNYKFKYRVGVESYTNIEKIKSINKVNNELLTNGIKAGSLDNMELLKLYKNYGELSDSMVSLWDDYSFYEESISFLDFNKKKIDKNDIKFNDIYGTIEEYLKSLMDEEMKTKSYKVELSGKTLEKFNSILSITEKVDLCYTDFYEKNLNNIDVEDREKTIIKKYYWIDILKEINIINQKYINSEIEV